MKTLISKIITAAMVACLVLMLCMTAGADEYAPAVLKTTPFEALPGGDVTTTLYVDENSGVIDFEFQLKYDAELVTLVSAEASETLVGDIEITPKDGAVHISYTRTSANLTKRMEFVDLTFTVNGNAGPDSYDFLSLDTDYQIEAHTMIDDDLFALPVEVEFAPLEIYGFGDVNTSGNVSIADVTYLRQYLAEMRTLSDYQMLVADAYYDETVSLKDAVRIQQYLADKTLQLGNRVIVSFFDKDGNLYRTKSALYGENLATIPPLPAYSGYYGGVWSTDPDVAEGTDFTELTEGLSVYAVYKKDPSAAVTFYKERLTSVYYSQPTLTGNLNLVNKLTYQDGYTADIYWSSSDSSVLNATTGVFNKPAYDSTLTLTATIISYQDGMIEAQDYIAFDYSVEGEYLCPSLEEIRAYLAGVLAGNIDYNMVLPSKITNSDINSSSKFEVRLTWTQINPDGTENRVVQLSRANDLQNVSLIAVATFDGKPLENDGCMYFDDIVLSTVSAEEIRNYIIKQIAANTGLSVTDGEHFWDDDDKYNTVIRWISMNHDVATIENNTVSINNVVNGTPLPINVEVTYTIGGETDTFTLAYTVDVVTDNALLVPGTNIDPALYDALKAATGVNGNLTTDALKNVKFVYLDLSGYPEIKDLSAITYCTNLRVLNISGLHVEESSLNQIATLSKLEALIANNCGISSMTVGGTPVLDKMINLKMLDLAHNELTSLDSVLSKDNRYGQMEELYLNDNQLTDISALCEVVDEENKIYDENGEVIDTVITTAIRNRAPMLRFLILDNNHLNDDDFAAFSNFKALKYLSLGNNELTTVSCFKDIRTLLELHLQGNHIEDVRDLRYLTGLQSLYLSHNNLRNVYTGSKEVNISYLKYLTNLEILYLNDNSIEDLSDLSALDKLLVLNINNNNVQSLAFLADKGETLVELYAENNEIDSFSFIRNLNKLTRLLLSGNSSVYESSLNSYLSGLTELRSLTLSGKDLRTLDFVKYMPNLVRLDAAGCNIPSYYPTIYEVTDAGNMYVTEYIDNVASLLSVKSSLQFLDISNNGFGYAGDEIAAFYDRCGANLDFDNLIIVGAVPQPFESLYELTNLKVFYADNLDENINAGRLFTLMTGLRYISMENSGIDDASWLYKFRNLVYVDLANNVCEDFDLGDYISTRSKGTLEYLYVDASADCDFADSFDGFDGNNLKELSLEGVNVEAIDKLPDMPSLEYLNLENTGITNLVGENSDFDGWFNLSRFSGVKTLDLTGVQADIDEVLRLPNLETFYAVGGVEDRIFQKNNLLSLYALYNNGVDSYLYGDTALYEPRAGVEGGIILGTLPEYSRAITVAANNAISDNNPVLASSVNGFDIEWALSNSKNYEIVNNKLSVKDYTDIDDEKLTITASIDVYPGQAPAARSFTFDVSVLRASGNEHINVNATGADNYLVRGSSFTYDVNCVPSAEYGFGSDVLPVYTEIRYSYSAVGTSGTTIPFGNLATATSDHHYTINSDAALGATFTIRVDIGHTKNGSFVIDKTITKAIQVANRTFTVTYVPNSGSVKSVVDGSTITSAKYMEESVLFNDITISRPGYAFDGWYTNSSCTTLFWKTGSTKPMMPSNDITLYAKWAPYSYLLLFNANGGSVSSSQLAVLNGSTYGTLPTPARTGYSFLGWFTSASGGTQIKNTTSVNQTADMTVYAHWDANPYTVTFNANGGSNPTSSSKSVTYNTAYGTLPTTTRTGFTFKGWYTSSTGGTSITSSSNMTTASNHTLYAQWTVNSYTASWNAGTNCSISVSRTSSPNAGAATGAITSGTKVYYGDVLSITYTANAGYSISNKGSTSITVGTSNITSSNIYATATANNYTYNVVYKSSNGTSLGSTTVTKAFGTTNTITAPGFTGYATPSSQSVKWDSTSAKTITFIYTPNSVGTQTLVNDGWWWNYNNKNGIKFTVSVAFSNRTSNSVTATITWTNRIISAFFGYNQYFNMSIGGVGTGDQLIASSSKWSSGRGSVTESVTKTATITITGLSPTTSSLSYYASTSCGASHPDPFSGTLTIPTY